MVIPMGGRKVCVYLRCFLLVAPPLAAFASPSQRSWQLLLLCNSLAFTDLPMTPLITLFL